MSGGQLGWDRARLSRGVDKHLGQSVRAEHYDEACHFTLAIELLLAQSATIGVLRSSFKMQKLVTLEM